MTFSFRVGTRLRLPALVLANALGKTGLGFAESVDYGGNISRKEFVTGQRQEGTK
jgi:hypothetical protein